MASRCRVEGALISTDSVKLGSASGTTGVTLASMVSSATQLQADADVCGEGVPTHTPDRRSQSYTNNTTGQIHKFWSGEWH